MANRVIVKVTDHGRTVEKAMMSMIDLLVNKDNHNAECFDTPGCMLEKN